MKRIYLLLTAVVCLFAACSPVGTTKLAKYQTLYDEQPVAVLVMPPINRSTKVEAKMSFYNTLSMPLSNNGYYALPPFISMQVMQDQSAYDSELLIDKSMKVLDKAFGADAVLFTIVHEWKKLSVANSIEIKIEYILKSTKTDEILYERMGVVTFRSSSNSGSILADLAVNILSTALTKEVELARSCNGYAFSDIPKGKYSPTHGKDQQEIAAEKEFKIQLSN